MPVVVALVRLSRWLSCRRGRKLVLAKSQLVFYYPLVFSVLLRSRENDYRQL